MSDGWPRLGGRSGGASSAGELAEYLECREPQRPVAGSAEAHFQVSPSRQTAARARPHPTAGDLWGCHGPPSATLSRAQHRPGLAGPGRIAAPPAARRRYLGPAGPAPRGASRGDTGGCDARRTDAGGRIPLTPLGAARGGHRLRGGRLGGRLPRARARALEGAKVKHGWPGSPRCRRRGACPPRAAGAPRRSHHAGHRHGGSCGLQAVLRGRVGRRRQ